MNDRDSCCMFMGIGLRSRVSGVKTPNKSVPSSSTAIGKRLMFLYMKVFGSLPRIAQAGLAVFRSSQRRDRRMEARIPSIAPNIIVIKKQTSHSSTSNPPTIPHAWA